MAELPRSYHNLEAKDFPFLVEARTAIGVVVWSKQIDGPGEIFVPPLRRKHGPVWIRVTFPDGRVEESPPT